MRRKVFQKHLNSTQIFQKQNFQSIYPQISNLNKFCIKNKELLILYDYNKITDNKMYDYEMKSFQKLLNSTQIFQNQDFQSICPQSANIKHILH